MVIFLSLDGLQHGFHRKNQHPNPQLKISVISATTIDRMLGLSWGVSCVQALASWISCNQISHNSFLEISLVVHNLHVYCEWEITFRTESNRQLSPSLGSTTLRRSSSESDWLRTSSNRIISIDKILGKFLYKQFSNYKIVSRGRE